MKFRKKYKYFDVLEINSNRKNWTEIITIFEFTRDGYPVPS